MTRGAWSDSLLRPRLGRLDRGDTLEDGVADAPGRQGWLRISSPSQQTWSAPTAAHSAATSPGGTGDDGAPNAATLDAAAATARDADAQVDGSGGGSSATLGIRASSPSASSSSRADRVLLSAEDERARQPVRQSDESFIIGMHHVSRSRERRRSQRAPYVSE